MQLGGRHYHYHHSRSWQPLEASRRIAAQGLQCMDYQRRLNLPGRVLDVVRYSF